MVTCLTAVTNGPLAGSAVRSKDVLLHARQPRLPIRRSLIVRAEKGNVGETQGVKIPDEKQQDSFTKIEAPVRPKSPGDGGPQMKDRLEDRDELFIQDGALEKDLLGTEVALSDAMRFKGAGPEIINGRLSMVAVLAAVGAELATGKTIVDQFQLAPAPIVGISTLFIVASLIPILKGVPRKNAAEFGGLPWFTSKAELINGRLAIIGFPCLLIQELINMAPTFGAPRPLSPSAGIMTTVLGRVQLSKWAGVLSLCIAHFASQR